MSTGSDLAFMPKFVDEKAGKTYQVVLEESDEEASALPSNSDDDLLSNAEMKCNAFITIS